MGAQFGTHAVSHAAEMSLTLIVDDIARANAGGLLAPKVGALDLDNWLNVLQQQSVPLVQSKALRENLEAWLEAVDAEFGELTPAP
jgi:hypothetical protein